MLDITGTSSLQRPPEEPAKITKAPFATLSVPLKAAVGTPEKQPPKYEPISFFVIIVMVALVLLNVILYFKLWNLEDSSAQSQAPLFDFRSLKWVVSANNFRQIHCCETSCLYLFVYGNSILGMHLRRKRTGFRFCSSKKCYTQRKLLNGKIFYKPPCNYCGR